ncbi:UNVERIFIED_CONTAM: hypothetical protein HHA_450580 [Hammondia hammondi]|eukprot:XP_008882905.1 hypothetical protein HHA_450580 [Hammondia hammondi]
MAATIVAESSEANREEESSGEPQAADTKSAAGTTAAVSPPEGVRTPHQSPAGVDQHGNKSGPRGVEDLRKMDGNFAPRRFAAWLLARGKARGSCYFFSRLAGAGE